MVPLLAAGATAGAAAGGSSISLTGLVLPLLRAATGAVVVAGVAALAAAGAAGAGSGLVWPRLAAGVLPRSGVAGGGVAMAGVLAAAGALLSGSWAITSVGSDAASLLTMRPELTGTLPGVVSGLLPEKLSRMGMAANATATSPAAMARRFFSSGLMAVADSPPWCGSLGEGVIA